MNPVRIVLAAGALVMSAAGLIAFWPVEAPTVPLKSSTEPTTQADVRFHSLAAQFDRSGLPDPAPTVAVQAEAEPPPPDAAQALRAYRYLGMAESDGRKAAVFANAGATQLMRPGDELEGFTLAAFDAEGALFELGDRDVRLALARD